MTISSGRVMELWQPLQRWRCCRSMLTVIWLVTDWRPFIKAAIERNPVCHELTWSGRIA
ncbi:MAG: hypothetical protein MZV63_23405 [Marinilabiliales bacterium]|nr:hypothetical protein [Marinilabiliales bacterium]